MIHLLVILPVVAACLLMLARSIRKVDTQPEYLASMGSLAFVLGGVVMCMMMAGIGYLWYSAGFYGASQQMVLLRESPDWLLESRYTWISSLGVTWHMAIDGLSLIFASMAAWVALMAMVLYRGVVSENRETYRRLTNTSGFHSTPRVTSAVYVVSAMMLMLASVYTILLTLDMLVLVLAWLVLVCTYYALWLYVCAHDDSTEKSTSKRQHVGGSAAPDSPNHWLVMSQLAGLLMLVAVLMLVVIHFNQHQQLSFGYIDLLHTQVSIKGASVLWVCFVSAVLLGLPIVGLHIWQVRAQQLPNYMMVLAMLLFVVSIYVLWRFVLPLFPVASAQSAGVILVLALVSQVYAALMAFATARPRQKHDVAVDDEHIDGTTWLPNRFLGYVMMFHGGVILFAVSIGTLQSWLTVVLYLLLAILGISGMYLIHSMLAQQARATASIRLMLVFFGVVAAAFPLLGFVVVHFELMASTFTTHPVHMLIVLLSFIMLYMAMAQHVRYRLRLMSSQTALLVSTPIQNAATEQDEPQKMSDESHRAKSEHTSPRLRLEWCILVLMSVVVVFISVSPQRYIDTAYESLRWIHHVYHKPYELHKRTMAADMADRQYQPYSQRRQRSRQVADKVGQR